MKLRHLSAIAILICGLFATPTTAAVKVFLLAGQSNMLGYSTGLPTTSPYDTSLPDVQFWNYANNGWIDLQPGLGDTANDIGPEIGFGHTLNSLFPDDDIYLVKYGVSSTNLAVDWNPNGSGTKYNTFKSRVDAALSNLAGQSPEIAGMIWMQGESDAQNTAYSTAYNANLTNFINTVRSDFSTPEMPFIVGRITDLSIYAGFPGTTDVRTAQVNVASTMNNVAWIDTDDIQQGSAAAHYSAAGQVVLGTRFANEFDTNGTTPDDPIASGTMGVQFDPNSGTMVANNNTIGWRFKATQDLTVSQLGCLNGVLTTGDAQAGKAHAVGIYDEATQQLLASAVVVNGAAGSTNQWSWTNLATPVTLTEGNVYRIATYANGDKWTFNTTNHSVGSGIAIGTDLAPGVPLDEDPGSRVAAYAPGNNLLQYPDVTSYWTSQDIYDGIFGANFTYKDAATPGTRGVHATGTLTLDPTAPTLPTNNLIMQGSNTLDHAFSGGATPKSWGTQLPGAMNSGVMTAADNAAYTILAWDGVTDDFGWAVYVLDTTTNTLGYDVSEILSYAGWTGARINQAIEIKYSLVGDTITEGEELGRTLGAFSYSPSDDSNSYVYTMMSITNDEDPLVLSGISAIEVKYIDNLFNGGEGHVGEAGNYTAYKQFAVIGTPTTGSAADIPGDANRDGKVDGSDVTILAGNWQVLENANWGMGDFNGDGKVDGSDVTILAGNWQAGVSNATASVPEPLTIVGLLGLALTGFLIRRK